MTQSLVVYCTLLLLSACANKAVIELEPVASPPPDAPAVDLTLGRRLHPTVEAYFGRYANDGLQGYVQRVGEQLVARNFNDQPVYRFTVLDADEANTFSLPGGYVYITRGLLAYLTSEAQLAALLAHELGHQIRGHFLYDLAQKRLVTATPQLLERALYAEKTAAELPSTPNIVDLLTTDQIDSQVELATFQQAALILAKGGYDPRVLTELSNLFFIPLEERRKTDSATHGVKSRLHDYHGMAKFTAEELTALDRYVSEAGQQQDPIPPDMLVRDHYYFQAIDGLNLAGSDANGVKRGDRLFHKEAGVTIALPPGWPVVLRRKWAIAYAPDGMAYIKLSQQEVTARIPPKKFMEKVFEHANLKSGDVEIVNQDKRGGFNARVAMETLYGRRSKQIKVIYVGTRATILESVSAAEQPPQRYAKEIVSAGRTLRPLKESESTLAGATKLEVKRVEKATTLRLLASPVKSEPKLIEQLRLLNQLSPGDEPRVGQYLKLVIEP